MSKAKKGASFSERRFLWLFVVFSTAFVSHASYIANQFSWLDHGDIELGRAILPLSQLKGSFLEAFGQTNFYRPLVTIINSIDYALFGGWAPGFHTTNVVLHAFASLAGFWFTQRFFGLKRNEALLVALVFAVHPVSWLPVGAISYRPEIMATLFTLLATSFHIESRLNSKARNVVLTLIFLSLALFSKETALFWFPTLIVVWEGGKKGTRGVGGIKKNLGLFMAEAFFLVSFIFLRGAAVGDVWAFSTRELGLSQAIGTRVLAVKQLFISLFVPLKPDLSDATEIVGFFDFRVILSLVFFLGVVVLAAKKGLSSLFTKLLMFFVIALFPTLNIVPLPRFSSPHYAYFASIGVGVLMVLFFREEELGRLGLLGRLGRLSLILGWGAIAVFSTFLAGFRFKNDLSLFAPEVAKDPQFLEGRHYLGNHYFNQQDFAKAQDQYEKILEANPSYIAYVDRQATYVNLAGIRLGQNRLGEAEELLVSAIAVDPKRADSSLFYNLALVSFKKGEYRQTVELLEGLDWERPEPYLLLSKAYLEIGDRNKSSEILEKVLRHFPGAR